MFNSLTLDIISPPFSFASFLLRVVFASTENTETAEQRTFIKTGSSPYQTRRNAYLFSRSQQYMTPSYIPQHRGQHTSMYIAMGRHSSSLSDVTERYNIPLKVKGFCTRPVQITSLPRKRRCSCEQWIHRAVSEVFLSWRAVHLSKWGRDGQGALPT